MYILAPICPPLLHNTQRPRHDARFADNFWRSISAPTLRFQQILSSNNANKIVALSPIDMLVPAGTLPLA